MASYASFLTRFRWKQNQVLDKNRVSKSKIIHTKVTFIYIIIMRLQMMILQ